MFMPHQGAGLIIENFPFEYGPEEYLAINAA
jgi:hypothetical protein